MKQIASFLAVSYCSGFGYGDGSGSGSGDGSGDGSGSFSGCGNVFCVGCGYGNGSGEGYCYGYGEGSGTGSGFGYGDGSGSGCGYGDGSGITLFCNRKVYHIDGVATIIDTVHGDFAIGNILNSDFTLTPCYIAKVENSFAHGSTLRQAFIDAKSKALRKKPLEHRILRFVETYPSPDKKIRATELFQWHNILTGSCRLGRELFCKEHGINIEFDQFTVHEFIELTKDSYGGAVIRQLADYYIT